MPTVFVWNNENLVKNNVKKMLHMKTKSDTYDGHASINITDEFTPFEALPDSVKYTDNTSVYGSWIPTEKSHRSGLMNRVKAVGKPSPNFFADLFRVGVIPDHVIRLPATNTEVRSMGSTWRGFLKSKTNSYDRIQKNSSRIVSRVLRSTSPGKRAASLLSGSIKQRSVAYGVWTPLMVKRLALNYPDAFPMTWRAFIGELMKHGVVGSRTAMVMMALKPRSEEHGSTMGERKGKYSRLVDLSPGDFEVLQGAIDAGTTPEMILYASMRDQGMPPGEAKIQVFKTLGASRQGDGPGVSNQRSATAFGRSVFALEKIVRGVASAGEIILECLD